MTDIVMIRALFSVLREYTDQELQERLDDVLNHLPDFLTLPLEMGSDWDGEVFTYGIGKGKVPAGVKMVFAAGRRPDTGEPVRSMYGDRKRPKYMKGMTNIECSPLYPAGILGLKDKGTSYFDNLTNQLSLHRVPVEESTMHWTMLPLFLARMGWAEELLPAIRALADVYQAFPNGFNAEEEEVGCRSPFEEPEWYKVCNTQTGNITKVKPDDFVHFDFESMSIAACAVVESLLQSHEGIIRICPAVRPQDPVAFRLYAEGGFAVEAEVSAQAYVITIENLLGESCYAALPEYVDEGHLHVYKRAKAGSFEQLEIRKIPLGNEEVYTFDDFKVDETILMSSKPLNQLELIKCPVRERNMQMKECGRASLGSPRLLY